MKIFLSLIFILFEPFAQGIIVPYDQASTYSLQWIQPADDLYEANHLVYTITDNDNFPIVVSVRCVDIQGSYICRTESLPSTLIGNHSVIVTAHNLIYRKNAPGIMLSSSSLPSIYEIK